MKIGVPKEIKPQENRIGLTPDSVKTLISNGHKVLIENNGGFEAGFENEQYIKSGAQIVEKAEDIFNDADIIVKVKEPLSNEIKMIKENQIVFTYLHLAAAKELTEGLVKSKSVCIAYETVTDNDGRLPLLAPMSAVAGRMSIQAGAHSLEKHQKGRGLLLGGAPGIEPANVVILGGGVVGENAALIATGMKSKVHIVDKSQKRLDQLKKIFGDRVLTALPIREQHARDFSFHDALPADAVVMVQSTNEVVEVVKSCAKYKVPIIPFGTGTSAEGHLSAIHGGICVDVSEMRNVIQGVGSRINSYYDRPWHDNEQRRTSIVIIGLSGIDREAIFDALRAD